MMNHIPYSSYIFLVQYYIYKLLLGVRIDHVIMSPSKAIPPKHYTLTHPVSSATRRERKRERGSRHRSRPPPPLHHILCRCRLRRHRRPHSRQPGSRLRRNGAGNRTSNCEVSRCFPSPVLWNCITFVFPVIYHTDR